MERLGLNATNSCFKSWSMIYISLWEPQVGQHLFKSLQWRSMCKQLQKMGYGCKVRSILWWARHLIHHYLQTQTQNTTHHHTPPYTTTHHHTPPHHRKQPHTTVAHHRTPPYTTIHHHTPPHTTLHHRTPPYTTIHHCRTPPATTLHQRAPPHTFTGYHWLHAVATIFDVCVGVNVHHHESTYMFGDPSKSCIHLYKQDATTHYEALVAGSVPYRPRRTPRMSSHKVHDLRFGDSGTGAL
jgi:hypothetical protein